MKNPLAIISNYLKRSYGPEDDFWYNPIARKSLTGLGVDEYNVLEVSSDVYKCVKVISETIASLPLFVYKRIKEGGKERADEHPLYDLLHIQPNPEMTSFQFRETMMSHLLTWGNFYAQIGRNGIGEVVAIWPLRPDRMELVRRADNGPLAYKYRPTDSKIEEIIFPWDDILHIPGLGFNGVVGYSPIAMAREAIALGVTASQFASRFFSNDATPPTVLTYPNKLSPVAFDNLKKSWNERHGGFKNAGTMGILEQGLDIKTIGIPLNDAQFLELRKFQRVEICGIFGVRPHLIGDLDRATFSNIEHQSLEYVTHTLRPWLVRIEQGMIVKLFTPKERKKYFPEFLVEGLLRGDINSRYAAYSVGRQWGWFNIDEIREKENMNPLDNERGKTYLMPLNMVEIDTSKSKEQEEKEAEEKAKKKTEEFLKKQEVVSKDEGKEEEKPTEQKEEKSKNIYLSFRRLFEGEIARIVRRETIAIQRALKRPDLNGFTIYMDNFYSELPEFIRSNLYPLLKCYADILAIENIDDVVIKFTDDYIGSSKMELASWCASREYGQQNESLEEILENWIENRPPSGSFRFYEIFNQKIGEKEEIPEKKDNLLTFSVDKIDVSALQNLLSNSTICSVMQWATT